MQHTRDILAQLNKTQIFGVCFITLLLVTVIDHLAGPQVTTAIFYLIPVGIAARYLSKNCFLWIAFVTVLTWAISDISSGVEYSSGMIPLWNFVMRSGLFVLVGYLIHSLQETAKYYEKLAQVDELSGLLNRRGFLVRVEEELVRARRCKRPFSIAYIDLDNFKQVNDTYGHKAGDELLRNVAESLKTYLRATDHVARVGGDEFTVLMVETNQAEAKKAFEKCSQALNQKLLIENVGVTASVGVVTYTKFDVSLAELLEKADQWMYRVKKHGKNRVEYRYDTETMGESAHPN